MFIRKKKAVYILLAATLAILMAVQVVPVMPESSAIAADFISSYNSLKNDPTSQVFLQRLFAAGATEADLESFLNDLDTEVQKQGLLNDANFNSVMFAALQDVVTWRKHRPMFNALSAAFPTEIGYTLEKGQLHPDLVPLRNAVRSSLLGTLTPGAGGPGGGGVSTQPTQPSAVSDQIADQLNKGVSRVELQPPAGSHEVTIPGSAVRRITEAGKELQLDFAAVRISVPAGAITIAEQANLSMSVVVVETAGSHPALAALSPAQKLAGDIYEFQAGTESSVRGFSFTKNITVTLPYQKTNLKPGEEDLLDAYYFDESNKRWVAMKGIINRSAQTVTFSTNHFSKYAVLVQDPALVVEKPPLTEPTVPPNFTDMNGHWAQGTIEKLAAQGIVGGITADKFYPNRGITRAEFATMLLRALNLPATTQLRGRFEDVPADAWYFSSVNAAAEAGLVAGISANRFAPNQPITREQLAVMVARALTLRGKTITGDEAQLTVFKDQKQISTWARKGVAQAIAGKIVGGRPDGTFGPSAPATRAEAATMIYNLLQ